MRTWLSEMIVSTWFVAILVLLPSDPVIAEQRNDQRGGIYLLVDVQLEEAQAAYLDELWPEVRAALAAERDTVGLTTREESPPTELIVQITEQQGATRAVELVKKAAASLGRPTKLWVSAVDVQVDNLQLKITLSEAAAAAIDKATMAKTLEILNHRVAEIGQGDIAVLPQGPDRIVFIAFGWEKAYGLFQLLTTRTQLSLNPVVEQTSDGQLDVAPGNMLLPSKDDPNTFYVVKTRPIVTGDDFENVDTYVDPYSKFGVQFKLSQTAAQHFGKHTSENIGRAFAIVLNDEVVSAPIVQSPILSGTGVITGSFTKEEATNIVKSLRLGALPTQLRFLEERRIGPAIHGYTAERKYKAD
ncbi:preprotein translocase subunit SecD [Halovulum sp. GXIMD14793]